MCMLSYYVIGSSGGKFPLGKNEVIRYYPVEHFWFICLYDIVVLISKTYQKIHQFAHNRSVICQALGNLRTFRHVIFITPLWNWDTVLYQKSLGTEESSGNFRRAPEKRLGWARTGQSCTKLLSEFCSTNQKRQAGTSSQSGATLTQAPIYTAAGPARPQSHRKYHSKLSYLKI